MARAWPLAGLPGRRSRLGRTLARDAVAGEAGQDQGAGECHRMASNRLMWQIAGGIVIGVTILGLLSTCGMLVTAVAVNSAVEQEMREHPITFDKPHAPAQMPSQAPWRFPSTAAYQTPRNAPATPAPVGERCIGKLLFRKLPNGYEQVTDGSASLYCK
jgi:hypothetical protein